MSGSPRSPFEPRDHRGHVAPDAVASHGQALCVQAMFPPAPGDPPRHHVALLEGCRVAGLLTGPPPLRRLAPRVPAESGWSLVSLLVTSDNPRRVSGEMAFMPCTSPLRSLMGAEGCRHAARHHPAPRCEDASGL